MPLRALQVYLTPDQHRWLEEEAKASHRSKAAIVRQLLDRHRGPASDRPTDLHDLAGVIQTEQPTDIATDRDQMLADAVRDLH